MNELDAIDVAYLQLEVPICVLRVSADTSNEQRAKFVREMHEITKLACVLLPPGYDVQVIGPGFTGGTPNELARWADDGGTV